MTEAADLIDKVALLKQKIRSKLYEANNNYGLPIKFGSDRPTAKAYDSATVLEWVLDHL